jgi:hypothetical protein
MAKYLTWDKIYLLDCPIYLQDIVQVTRLLLKLEVETKGVVGNLVDQYLENDFLQTDQTDRREEETEVIEIVEGEKLLQMGVCTEES